MVKLSLTLPPKPDNRWQLAKQIGVQYAVVHTLEIGDGSRFWEYSELLGMKNWFESAGLSISVIEGGIPLTDTTRLGRDGRDKEIAKFKQFLRDVGDLGIPIVCYDWVAGTRWARTSAHQESRGGSLVTMYDDRKMPDDRDTTITREQLWENLEYFLDKVLPVAEDAGVTLALHPDDPPRESLGGMPRIINSPEAYNRLFEQFPSENNGMTFCQGNFAAMGVDIPKQIQHFGDRIKFVHFRDVDGDADHFVETWHDDGPTDMLAAMRAYQDIGFEGPMRPDHVPTMAGENNSNPGYHTKGRLFAIGYIRGLLEQADAF
ncbi:mannonate dehydratase [Halobellus ruber]|uniref:mannonate dehydratase n=1 Tax=Halobellus ruber TaxID=2761102 RepID=A0A7J9SNG4_9EURY|nr:mannonate dehydratase [Halobellus ruber]MBB6647769.1 mannonate dehydratase [Halobellus ruber]